MGLLNRLLDRRGSADPSGNGSSPSWSPVELLRPDRLDPFLTDRELRAAFRVLVDGDWRRLERFLEVSPRAWMFGPIVTGEIVGMETVMFERWVDHQRSPRSRVFLANALIRDAFAERRAAETRREGPRGGTFPLPPPPSQPAWESPNGDGDHVDPDAFWEERPLDAAIDEWLDDDDRFVTQLNAAEELLYEVISERPAMADPWVGLLISGRALQVDLDELRERFENVHSRDPFRPDGCVQYLQGLTKKWGGSNVASFDLARWLEEESPPASPARLALPMAHIERGLLQYGPDRLAAYLTQPDVAAEVGNGLMRFLQSIPSPAPAEVLGVLNAYVLALPAESRMNVGLLTDALGRIDNRPTEWPWSVFSDDVAAVFAEVQADQLRLASRH
ncbi:MAG: hypothetical protein AAGA93_11700 [Actinomycetota bacterium]